MHNLNKNSSIILYYFLNQKDFPADHVKYLHIFLFPHSREHVKEQKTSLETKKQTVTLFLGIFIGY